MLTIPINNQSNIPLYQQIYSFIKTEIQEGKLKAGDKLPSSRILASNLDVSRNTIDIAYDQLLCEGYIDSYPRKGYYVNQLTYHQSFTPPLNPLPKRSTARQETVYDYDFSPDDVDIAHFPHSIWRRLSKEQMNDTDLFSLGDHQGDSDFRMAIASYLHGSRGVNCSLDQIVVGAGVDFLLLLLTRILDKNKSIAMENPAYQRARHIFSSNEFAIHDIPVNDTGMDLDALSTSDSSYCYVTPSHQFPLGSIMPVSNRQKLLSWATKEPGRYIIEDDHDSEFRYKGKPIPSLQGMDTQGKVIYIGTLSKAIAPAIRVGYMVLPPDLLTDYQKHCSYFACTVSRIDQALLTSFITEGYFEKHLNRMRKIYKSKHDLVLSLLKNKDVEIHGSNAGLYLVVYLNNKIGPDQENQIIDSARTNRIKLYGLYEYYTCIPDIYRPGFLLGFGSLTEQQLQEGIHLLCEKVLCEH